MSKEGFFSDLLFPFRLVKAYCAEIISSARTFQEVQRIFLRSHTWQGISSLTTQRGLWSRKIKHGMEMCWQRPVRNISSGEEERVSVVHLFHLPCIMRQCSPQVFRNYLVSEWQIPEGPKDDPWENKIRSIIAMKPHGALQGGKQYWTQENRVQKWSPSTV